MIYGLYRYSCHVCSRFQYTNAYRHDLHDDIGAKFDQDRHFSEVAQQRLEHNLGEKENGKDSLLVSVAEISRESVSSWATLSG